MTDNPALLYNIALTMVPNIGSVQAKILIDHFGSAANIFKAKKSTLSAVENIGEVRAKSIKDFDAFSLAEKEIDFITKFAIQPLFLTDAAYPKRLLHCYDSPTMLYYKGNTDLNAERIISIIGTRNNTDYGRQVTEKLVGDLQAENVLILSGLAFGIDSIAHKAALQNHLPTVAVLAHGLSSIYPSQHQSLAKELTAQGGLLTEFLHNTKPDKHNFPRRNRIVAGLADATIVIETALRGGSMITAELANNYNRDVFAIPGKTTDNKSSGCNHLIRQNKAALLTDAQQLLENLGWKPKPVKKKKQMELFIELSPEEKLVISVLREKELTSIDEIYFKTGLSSSLVAAAMLNLELQGIIHSLPGKMYKLE